MIKKQFVSMRLLPTIAILTLAFGLLMSLQGTICYADDTSYPTVTLQQKGAWEEIEWRVLKTEPFNTTGQAADATFESYKMGTPIERTWKNSEGVTPWFSVNQATMLEKCGKPTGISLAKDDGSVLLAFYASNIELGLEKNDIGDEFNYSPSITSDGKPGAESGGDIYWYSSLYYDLDFDNYQLRASKSIMPPQGWVEIFHGNNFCKKTESVTTENHIITVYFNGEERKLLLDTENNMEIVVGEKSIRVATTQSSYYGDAVVSYASSNEGIATVDVASGEVTGVAEGEATITASIQDGDKETSASYKVVVSKAADPAVDNVVLAIDNLPEPEKLTLDNENDVNAAQDAYDGLSPEQRTKVTNYNVLLEARLKIADLKLKKAEADIVELTTAKETAEGELQKAEDEKQAALDELNNVKAEIAASKLTVSGLKVTSKAKKFTITWKKNAKADGYQVQYKLKSAKKYKTLKTLTGIKAVSKKLKKGKKYQFRVATYKTVDGKKIYGKWVKTKVVKCK